MFAWSGRNAGARASATQSSPSNESTWFGNRLAMPEKLIDGKAIAEQINAETVAEIAGLKEQHRLTPGLAVVLVGEDPASATYVSMKDKMCARLGLHSERVNLPASTSEGELLAILNDLNFKCEVHGILVQSPLPPQISATTIFAAVD